MPADLSNLGCRLATDSERQSEVGEELPPVTFDNLLDSHHSGFQQLISAISCQSRVGLRKTLQDLTQLVRLAPRGGLKERPKHIESPAWETIKNGMRVLSGQKE